MEADGIEQQKPQFTQPHQNWIIEDCKNIVWSDKFISAVTFGWLGQNSV